MWLFPSVCFEQVLSQLSHAIVAALPTLHPCHPFLSGVLRELAKWDSRPNQLREMAYEWCSAICERHPDFEDGEELLLLSLKIGFRGLDFRCQREDIGLDHTKHHQTMIDIVFNSGDDEAIADLLQAWSSTDSSYISYQLLGKCARHLIGLQHIASASPRLRRLVIRSVESTSFRPFEWVGVGEFAVLLDRLNISINDMDLWYKWLGHLTSVALFPQGRSSLPRRYWELMVELAVTWFWPRRDPTDHQRQTMVSLEEDQEWDLLECWIGFIWIVWCPETNAAQEDVERVTLSLFRQRPGAIQKLEQWVRRSNMGEPTECVERLRQVCERGGFGMDLRQDTP